MTAVSFNIGDDLNSALASCNIDIQQRLTVFVQQLTDETANIIRASLAAQVAQLSLPDLVAQQSVLQKVSSTPQKAVIP